MQRQEGLLIQGVNVMVPQRRVFYVCASKLASDENLGHQHMGGCDHREEVRLQVQVVERGKEATMSPVGLSYPKVKRRLERRWTRRNTIVPQRRIYRSRRKGCRCKVMDSWVIGLVAPWYRRGGTSVESSIPCSHGGRALVVKGAEEVENAKANSKYQDRAEGRDQGTS
ncbi:hypothetical protein B296_00051220 [Ensete ventricosum]|uniref:Uncharacterized protein n=1 Tax=Ensete ventricosum TaxID=4639 RepID=A0A426WZF3_ENSVE|nr:hypothetical protein B296_00051220 [Ensete ventricosum]